MQLDQMCRGFGAAMFSDNFAVGTSHDASIEGGRSVLRCCYIEGMVRAIADLNACWRDEDTE